MSQRAPSTGRTRVVGTGAGGDQNTAGRPELFICADCGTQVCGGQDSCWSCKAPLCVCMKLGQATKHYCTVCGRKCTPCDFDGPAESRFCRFCGKGEHLVRRELCAVPPSRRPRPPPNLSATMWNPTHRLPPAPAATPCRPAPCPPPCRPAPCPPPCRGAGGANGATL